MIEASWHPADSPVPRRFCKPFYADLRRGLGSERVREERILSAPTGAVFRSGAGELTTIELVEGPQMVSLFLVNPSDPDERYWATQTGLSEGMFLTRYSRLWGTMARYRPLLTLLDDTVTPRPFLDVPHAAHHPVFGDYGTPAEWQYCGGAPGVTSSWEQLVAAAQSAGVASDLPTEPACLFQKSAFDAVTQRWRILPTDAVKGDRVTFFSEIDLLVLVALSPFVDGSRPAADLAGAAPRAVRIALSEPVAAPLGWPYEGQPYPDLSLYLNEEGVRSSEPAQTQGRESW